jgi:hypothetical protein
MRLLWTLSVAAAAAFTSYRTLEASAIPAAGSGQASRSIFHTSSAIASLRVARANAVPAAAPRVGIDEYCVGLGYEKVPRTSLGREIARRGWHITSEVFVGGYVAIAFVRNLVAGTSGICYPVEGHVAISDRSGAMAIISNIREPRPENYVNESGLGEVSVVPGSQALRITDNTGPSPPIADVRLDAGGVRVVPVAARDSICHGRASIPNVFGQTMPAATHVLGRHGWRATGTQRSLRDCSGTGVGYCIFTYVQGRRSIELITAWENHEVVRYRPHC